MPKKLSRKFKVSSTKSTSDILNKLDAYASSFLTTDGDSWKNIKRDNPKIEFSDIGDSGISSGKSIRQKKKLRKLRRQKLENDESEIGLDDSVKSENTTPRKKSKKEKLLEEMGLDLQVPLAKEEHETKLDITAGNTYKLDDKIVVFRDLAKKRPKMDVLTNVDSEIEDSTQPKSDEFNMKRARHEVLRFGISGFEKHSKEQANIALAIKLGAKPPKKTFKNYKLLMEEKRTMKIEENNNTGLDNKPGLLRTTSSKKNKPRDKNKVAGFDSQIGRYKNGIQIVSKREIQKVIQGPKKRSRISAIKGL